MVPQFTFQYSWKQSFSTFQLIKFAFEALTVSIYADMPHINGQKQFISASQELMVNQDRYGLFRPTADGDGKMIHAEWATCTNVHIDVSAVFNQ